MHTIPGEKIGEFSRVDHVPDGSLAIPSACLKALSEVESKVGGLVDGVRRVVTAESLQYQTRRGKVFLRIRFRGKALRLIFPGNALTFVDPHGLTRELKVPEWGKGNMALDLDGTEHTDVLEEYLVTALSLVGHYAPPQHDHHEDDGYSMELTDGFYEGPMVGGKPHGVGKFTWKDGSVYEGSFINGAVSGNGRFTRSNGEVFEGRFLNGMMSDDPTTPSGRDRPGRRAAGGDGALSIPVYSFGYIF